MEDDLIIKPGAEISRHTSGHIDLAQFERALEGIRTDVHSNAQLREVFLVLRVGGHRSAISALWSAVITDLRRKVEIRSLALFNKALAEGRKKISGPEDFFAITDEELIEGAFRIGVIEWEARMGLRRAKETRDLAERAPFSAEPSLVKVMDMLEDCVHHMLSQPDPPPIPGLDEVLDVLGEMSFVRDATATGRMLDEFPDTYKSDLAFRLFTSYIDPGAASVLRMNIEFVAPHLWLVLPTAVKKEVAALVDEQLYSGSDFALDEALAFMRMVDSVRFLTATARRHVVRPLIEDLAASLGSMAQEDAILRELHPYAAVIPPDLLPTYIAALTLSYVGDVTESVLFSRVDLVSPVASELVPQMCRVLGRRGAEEFVDVVRTNSELKQRLKHASQLRRLRVLADIFLEQTSATILRREILEILVDESREVEFMSLLFGEES